ncbi:hypothetical protein CFOL_v3_08686, partial [Cephalotus follicularis]
AYDLLTSFDFAFILHLMKEIMGITDVLSQFLQQKSQYIVNAMQLMASLKLLIQSLRDNGWKNLLNDVRAFYVNHNIEIRKMSARFIMNRARSPSKENHKTIEHHYWVERYSLLLLILNFKR